MSEKLTKLARKYAQQVNQKQMRLFLRGLTEFPTKQRMLLAIKIFFNIPLVKFTKKEESDIKAGRFLK